MPEIDFWYSIGSTYSFLTVMRLDDWCAEHDATVNWRPFNVRTVMSAQQNIPFAGKPEKSAYMWRDIERRCAKYHIHASLPAPYPISDLALANQVALLGMTDGWGKSFTQNLYRIWFEDGVEAGSESALSEALLRCQQDPRLTLARARSPDIVTALEAETDIAVKLGVFGAPSFVVRQEVFWGDDRLDDALSWARVGHVV
ncbi:MULTISPECIES: 2-hydroxychromene-2-carboxylate isomerase [Ruegeria]|uniref:2-hydroxychromene-2-carboxylate isomerase n=1 Tax=Ruegeria TaxID=97050 RepID=UPI001490A9D8|nr:MULTISPECIES: 2-hydroxychromene-2-carboxylate isomerase [Ruegeria]MCA0906251.1 2-hydroxychromene-2-carboxylate isomerase [Ruegeria marisrubri]NOC45026.1 2-hydroxychromene-2-carboxylate isomerase [Ruegeria sp. HKCCD7559]